MRGWLVFKTIAKFFKLDEFDLDQLKLGGFAPIAMLGNGHRYAKNAQLTAKNYGDRILLVAIDNRDPVLVGPRCEIALDGGVEVVWMPWPNPLPRRVKKRAASKRKRRL
jgi:hypothetical protein